MAVDYVFFLIELFFACFFCHAAATGLRPQRASEATLFYLLFAAGGAAGSFLIGIAAPLASTYNLDLPLTFLVTALLALVVTWRGIWSQRVVWIVASIGMVALVFMVRHAYKHDTTVATRNFYASLRVTQDLFSYPGATVRTLMNGSIQHGTQIFGTDDLRHTPTTYYAHDSGVGLAVRFCCGDEQHARPRSIGVIGLGAGTIAAYGRAGDHIRFYEINPAVPPIARNVLTYIRDSPAQIDIVEGDARTSLASHEAASALRCPRSRCLLRRCHPDPPAYARGPRPLPSPPCSRRYSCVPYLQPTCRSRTADRRHGRFRRYGGAPCL